eukprot:1155354-Pelagomonas_calceolata.AAC.1
MLINVLAQDVLSRRLQEVLSTLITEIRQGGTHGVSVLSFLFSLIDVGSAITAFVGVCVGVCPAALVGGYSDSHWLAASKFEGHLMHAVTFTFLANPGYRPQCFRSAALVGGYSDVTLPKCMQSFWGWRPLLSFSNCVGRTRINQNSIREAGVEPLLVREIGTFLSRKD